MHVTQYMNHIIFFFVLNIFNEIYLIYSVVLITAVQQSDSVIYIYICILFYILFYYGLS